MIIRDFSVPKEVDNREEIDIIKSKKPRFKDIIGYSLEFAGWTERYMKEKNSGSLVDISSDISVNKQNMQAVGNSIYAKELGDLPDTDRDIREFSCDCGNVYGRFFDEKR